MTKVLVLLCCLCSVVAAKDSKIRLEDIEKDNLDSERSVNLQARGPQTPPKMQFGFTPMKVHYQNQQSYAPQSNPQYVAQQQALQYPQQQALRYPQQQGLQYPQQQALRYTQEQALRYPQQVQYVQQYQQPIQYVSPTAAQQYVGEQRYQHYENVPYITGNQLDSGAHQSQYYQPKGGAYQKENQQYQYYYIQPTSASNNIQSVVDPKTGQVQYFMLVPAYTEAAGPQETSTQEIKNPEEQYQYGLPQEQIAQKYTQVQYVQEAPKQTSLRYAQPEEQPVSNHLDSEMGYAPQGGYIQQGNYAQEGYVQPETNYVQEKYAQQAEYVQQAKYVQPQVKYVQAQSNYVQPEASFAQPEAVQPQYYPRNQVGAHHHKGAYPQEHIISRSHPSLLDSYVPSVLQIRYYKEQEARLNALRESAKLGVGFAGKAVFAKNPRAYLPAPSPLSYTHTKRGATDNKKS